MTMRIDMKARSIEKRIGRKLEMRRRRRGLVPKTKSLQKQVIPRLDSRKPIEGPSHHARIEDVEKDLRVAIGALNKEEPRAIVEDLDEQAIIPMHKLVSRFILMQLGGWRTEGDNVVHSGGHTIPKGKLDVKEGNLIGPTGKQFFICETEKLHKVREILEQNIKLLDLERKYDLFAGLQEALDGRAKA
jgi:hypothetical protein